MTVGLDPVIHQQTRLQILANLYRNRQASFIDLRDGLGLTPGNLQAHVARLEEAGYVESGRVLVDLSFQVRYRITREGVRAFRMYLDRLHGLLEGLDAPGPGPAMRDKDAPEGASGPRPPGAHDDAPPSSL